MKNTKKKGNRFSGFLFVSLLMHAGLISLVYSHSQIYEDRGQQILLVNLMDTFSEKYMDRFGNTEIDQNTIEQKQFQSLSPGKFTEATVSLNEPESQFVSYLTTVKRRIDTVWNYPQSAQKARQDGSLDLQFSILRTGIIKQVQLLRSSGYTELDNEALRAITVSSPLPPLPEHLRLTRLNILATFEYRIEHE